MRSSICSRSCLDQFVGNRYGTAAGAAAEAAVHESEP